MAELDQIYVENPTKEDFEVRFNGEMYRLGAGEKEQKPKYLARHIAKHLSDKMLQEDIEVEKKKYEKRKEKMPEVVQTQIIMYDNPHRRIALYKILRSKEEVEFVIKSFPQFKSMDIDGKTDNFIGEMKTYDDFVDEYETTSSSEETQAV